MTRDSLVNLLSSEPTHLDLEVAAVSHDNNVVVLAVGRRVASVGVAWDGRDSRGIEPDRKRMGRMSKCAVV
jgi:hypothetical protein